MDAPAARTAAASSSATKGPPPAAKKTRNRKKKGRGAAPAPAAGAAPVATLSSSPEALEDAESASSCSVEGSTSTARRSFSPLSGSSSQRCSSEEEGEEDYEEDDYSSESEEEGESSYKPGGYHRVQVGEVYNSRFEVLEKLGWGHFSTVWKCLDRQTGAMVAMKVQKSARHYTEAAKDEIELLECTVHAARSEYKSMEQQEAIKVVRLVDSFEHKGPNGVHVCMVFEMMGDNLLTLIKYYNYRGVPMQLVQRLTRDMMEGLAFLHDKCQIIHTDLKPENVLLSHHIPQLPKIRKTQWEEFRAMRLARRQKGAKTPKSGGKASTNAQIGTANSAADGTEMSKEEKKRLKNRLKKKRQKQRKQADREASVDLGIGNGKLDSTARPMVTSNDSQAVDKLSNSLSQLTVSNGADHKGATDHAFQANFCGQNNVAGEEDSDVSSERKWYHQVGQVGDEEDKDWVHLPPEFAARVMLLLPEGRVAGSKRKEREFTLCVSTKSTHSPAETTNNHDDESEDKAVETSFVLRYLDQVDEDVVNSIEEQVSGLQKGSAPKKVVDSPATKYRLWRLEFDARYTHAVLGYLESRVEGLQFLNLSTSSGLALPGFFLPTPPSNEDIKTAAKAKTKSANTDDGVLDVVIQGINLLPLAGSVDKNSLEVKPLQERLGRWAARFNQLANSEMFDLMKLNAKICDLGNACWTTKHFTNDIQTRQYRCPEVILGKRYDTSADIWSMACFVFELLTGDLLFDPKTGRNFNRDEDHLAQMIELLGRMPKSFTGSQRGLREFFNRKGDLKRIRSLKFWSLQQVLIEKYHFSRHDAECLASFLGPMLRYDPTKRATAEECLAHPWLAHVDDVAEEGFAGSKEDRK
ncbi:CMGC/SRPK protein kinase [Phytophthora cinnamomi]|uniref:CMGC/SRPK protein kinase n=1 Tax=Phytophthora cinnamomi TaxID=4785 RepID=UPI00355A761F|nr:CMGC/SRPK protein kinase [Phytophthora cinnamomi]